VTLLYEVKEFRIPSTQLNDQGRYLERIENVSIGVHLSTKGKSSKETD